MDLGIGLGIGRLVFRALNLAEVALAAAVLIAVAVGDVPGRAVVVTTYGLAARQAIST